jgi:hypothetical protein
METSTRIWHGRTRCCLTVLEFIVAPAIEDSRGSEFFAADNFLKKTAKTAGSAETVLTNLIHKIFAVLGLLSRAVSDSVPLGRRAASRLHAASCLDASRQQVLGT